MTTAYIASPVIRLVYTRSFFCLTEETTTLFSRTPKRRDVEEEIASFVETNDYLPTQVS